MDISKSENGLYVFDNEDLSIIYDFWAETGIPAIRITNQSEQTLYLGFHESELVINQNRFNYYNPSPGAYGPFPPASEKPQVALVPGEIIDLELYPLVLEWSKIAKKNHTLYFKAKHSPFVIQNNLTYTLKNLNGPKKQLQHQFWVSQLSQISAKEFKEINRPHASNADKFYLKKDSSPFWREVLFETSLGLLPLLFSL